MKNKCCLNCESVYVCSKCKRKICEKVSDSRCVLKDGFILNYSKDGDSKICLTCFKKQNGGNDAKIYLSSSGNYRCANVL